MNPMLNDMECANYVEALLKITKTLERERNLSSEVLYSTAATILAAQIIAKS